MLRKSFLNKILFVAGLLFFALVGCKKETFTPKPRGYFRLEFPTADSNKVFTHTACDFTFSYPDYVSIEQDTLFFDEKPDHPCWLNVNYPSLNATIHMSYKPLRKNNLVDLTEDYHKMKSEHVTRADYIDEAVLYDSLKHNYGLLSKIGGDVASTYQFYLTDSSKHFVRGALYFKTEANVDSLQPALDFVKKDLLQMLDTWQWTN